MMATIKGEHNVTAEGRRAITLELLKTLHLDENKDLLLNSRKVCVEGGEHEDNSRYVFPLCCLWSAFEPLSVYYTSQGALVGK